jgi:hypothetical protein
LVGEVVDSVVGLLDFGRSGAGVKDVDHLGARLRLLVTLGTNMATDGEGIADWWRLAVPSVEGHPGSVMALVQTV